MKADAAATFTALRTGVRHEEPAYVAVLRLLTVGGRIPFQQGTAALRPRDLAIVHQLIGIESLQLQPLTEDPAAGALLVCLSAQGRLSFTDPTDTDHTTLPTAAATLTLTPTMWERVEEEVATWELAEQQALTEVDALLSAWADSDVLTARVLEVLDWVDRVETVMIYIGEEVFTRSDAGTNTLLRDGVLARLAKIGLESWSAAERLFVAAAHLLFTTGRSIRFEEFNGQQLTATALRNWLVVTWRRYAHAVERAVPADLAARPLDQLASEIRELSTAVDQSAWVRFRRIAGPTFAKSEELAHLPGSQRSHRTIPPLVTTFATNTLNTAIDSTLSAEEAVVTIAKHALSLPTPTAVAVLEQLLATIVRAAAIEVNADYAMSSAIRDIALLAPAAQGRVDTVLTLRKPDFFCCVIPNPNQLGNDHGPEIRRMLWLVAQRMQYNRWHFVPGNFTRAEIPAQRHYFFPPLLPDIAEHSDLWHGGHIAAQVRYSIRAPGAQLWRDALTVGGSPYRGCFDIRAVRMTGDPFERKDLWAAVRYSGLVDALWRTVAAQVNQGSIAPAVTAFDKQWYDRAAWAECGAFE